MIVTLYKECKLNNKYNDCFFNKSYLETYLGTLVKKSFTIDDTFSREQDRLVFENEEYFITKDYNYIKIEDTVIGTFYAFIRSIEWVNGLFLLYYEEDIWHNWFESIKVRNGLLTRSLSKKIHYSGETEKSIKYFSYPIESESNDTPSTTKLTGNKLGLVAKIQFYTLSQQGEENRRQERIFCIGIKEYDYSTQGYYIRTDFYNDISTTVEHLIRGQQDNTINTQYYQIDELYAVPLEFTTFDSEVAITSSMLTGNIDGVDLYFLDILGSTLHASNTPVKSFTYSVTYDRKNFAIGNYSNPIKFNNNGTNVNVSVDIWGVNTYKIILKLNNNIIDITKDYYVDLPFNTITASALQIKRMQYVNDKATYETYITNLNNDIALNKAKEVGGTIRTIGNTIFNPLRAVSELGNQINEQLTYEKNIYNAQHEIELYETKLKNLNKKIYDNTYIIKNDVNYINGAKGLLVWSVVEDNTEQVDGVKNLFGFIVNQIITKNIFTTEENTSVAGSTEKYNIYKFDDVSVYGAIAQDYITLFESILNKGVRIWFKGDIQI